MNEDTTYIETYTESDSGITDAMIEEYEIQDSIFCANQQPSDTVFDNTNDGLNYYLEQKYNEPVNTKPPWYTEYNPLVYLGVLVILLLIYKKLKK